jgi:Hypothetical protein (DUF2513)
MIRDWNLIRGLLRAIDVDYSDDDRTKLLGCIAVKYGVRSLNYHLTLLYEAKLVRYERPLYSADSGQIESEPIQLTKDGVELLTLIRDNSAWEAVTSTFNYGGSISASQSILASKLKEYFLSATIAA